MRGIRSALFVVALGAAIVAGVGAMQAPPSGAISGVVSDIATGRPLEGVSVQLAPNGATPRPPAPPLIPGVPAPPPPQSDNDTITDADGRFAFNNRTAGRYVVTAKKSGFFESSFKIGVPATGGRTLIVLGDGEKYKTADIKLVGIASIAGRVTDERGASAAEVFVRLLLTIPIAGRDRVFAGTVAKTDSEGRYAFKDLQPGGYRVMVLAAQHARQGALVNPRIYRQLFFPDQTDFGGSSLLVLRPGESRDGIDFVHRPVAGWKVSGRLKGSADAYSGLVLRLVPTGLDDIGASGDAATTVVGADGAFTFLGVPLGSYTLIANRAILEFSYTAVPFASRIKIPTTPGLVMAINTPGPMFVPGWQNLTFTSTRAPGPPYSGRVLLSVDRADVTGVTVEMTDTASLRMRFVLEPGGPRLSANRIVLDPVSGGGEPFSAAAISPGDQPFVIDGIPPGEYVLHDAIALWKSATFGGEDRLGRPIRIDASTSGNLFEVTHATGRGGVSGIVRDDKGAPAPGANIIVFPVDETLWTDFGFSPQWITVSHASTAGDFTAGNFAGEFYVVGIPADRVLTWPNVDLLRVAKVHATRVKLETGKTATVEAKLLTALPR